MIHFLYFYKKVISFTMLMMCDIDRWFFFMFMPRVSVCICMCLIFTYIFPSVVCVYLVIYVFFVLVFLSLRPCLPFSLFIAVSLSEGSSSSQTLREEMEAPPPNPPHSRQGRFQVVVSIFFCFVFISATQLVWIVIAVWTSMWRVLCH